MTDAQKEDVQQRGASMVWLVSQVQVSLMMADVYRDNGDAEAAEGALQTVNRVLDRINEHLTVFREFAKGDSTCAT